MIEERDIERERLKRTCRSLVPYSILKTSAPKVVVVMKTLAQCSCLACWVALAVQRQRKGRERGRAHTLAATL